MCGGGASDDGVYRAISMVFLQVETTHTTATARGRARRRGCSHLPRGKCVCCVCGLFFQPCACSLFACMKEACASTASREELLLRARRMSMLVALAAAQNRAAGSAARLWLSGGCWKGEECCHPWTSRSRTKGGVVTSLHHQPARGGVEGERNHVRAHLGPARRAVGGTPARLPSLSQASRLSPSRSVAPRAARAARS